MAEVALARYEMASKRTSCLAAGDSSSLFGKKFLCDRFGLADRGDLAGLASDASG
jgi:hypothetical protein